MTDILQKVDCYENHEYSGNRWSVVSSVEAPESHLCKDEGCPHFGTPHVCYNANLEEMTVANLQLYTQLMKDKLAELEKL